MTNVSTGFLTRKGLTPAQARKELARARGRRPVGRQPNPARKARDEFIAYCVEALRFAYGDRRNDLQRAIREVARAWGLSVNTVAKAHKVHGKRHRGALPRLMGHYDNLSRVGVLDAVAEMREYFDRVDLVTRGVRAGLVKPGEIDRLLR